MSFAIKLFFLLKEWTDFYQDPSEGNENFAINCTGRNNISSFDNAYVHSCNFKNISGIGDGGVIYYSKDSKLLVE